MGKVRIGQRSGRHIGSRAAGYEDLLRSGLRLFRFLCAVNQSGQLVGKDLLRLVELCAFPLFHLLDLL